jgi:Holliday junction resolvasome RuvABC endonuclease subunit
LSDLVVLGTDPGQVALGWCVTRFFAQRRSIVARGTIRDVTADSIVRWLNLTCCAHYPDVIAIEDYGWYGEEKSANQNSFLLARLVGDLEGAALMWSVVCAESRTRVIRVRKADANRFVGLHGKSPKSRVKAVIEALFPGVPFANGHERDAAVVSVVGRRAA